MIKYLLLTLLYFAFFATKAQSIMDHKGISFFELDSWKHVVAKAKKENKFIFVDCFATWCTPCKEMDRNIFSQPEVGSFFNARFISVKIQMDRKATDDRKVKRWYSTAANFTKQYGIPTYPTFLFFSPNGKLVYRDGGLKFGNELIEIATRALNPSVSVPFKDYYEAISLYQQGHKDYSKMAELADTASKLHQNDIARVISEDYRKFLLGAKQSEWYKPKNLRFMTSFSKGSNDTFFTVFYKHGNKVDSILDSKGFAQRFVDKVIQREEIEPFTNMEIVVNSSDYTPIEEKEPDWNKLMGKIRDKYSHEFAERNVLFARAQWYMDHHEWALDAKYFTLFIQKYPPTYFDTQTNLFLNAHCWIAIFLRSVDKNQIDAAIHSMKTMISARRAEKDGVPPAILDTYANLLYKAGNKSEAIQIEEEAAKKDSEYYGTLERMKQNRPTWPHYIGKSFMEAGVTD